MKHLSSLITTVLILASGITSHGARLTKTDKEVLSLHFKLCNQMTAMNDEAYNALNLLMSDINKYSYAIDALQKGNSSKIKSQISNLERNKKYAERSIKYSQKNYNSHKQKINSIKRDKKIEAEISVLEKHKNTLTAKINRLKAPFEKRTSTILAKINQKVKNIELEKLVESAMRPSGNNNKMADLVSRKSSNANYADGFVSCQWYKGNTRIAWAHIRLRPKDKNISRRNTIADKYPITTSSDNSVWFWVENMYICFVVDDKQYKSKEKVIELASLLFDLKKLADACDSKDIKQSVTIYEFIDQIKKDMRKATQKYSKQRSDIIRKLRDYEKQGYYSSDALAKLNSDLRSAKNLYENNLKSIESSDKIVAQLKTPSSNRNQAIKTLNKMIAESKEKIAAACKKLNNQKAKFTKSINIPKLNSSYQYIANKFFRVPNNSEFFMINRTAIDPWFGIPVINCRWYYDMSTSQRPASQACFSGKLTYYPDFKPSSSKGLINNKYVICNLNQYSISVKVGDFIIYLSSNNRILFTEKIYMKAVQELFDLDAIAEAGTAAP